MPLRGQAHTSHSSSAQAPFFRTLMELDQWAARPHEPFEGVLPFNPRRKVDGVDDEGKGRLLVCHDYKGGYTESPTALSYTFNFWWACQTFIYFSHHRVTVPPPGWITAAHRQGVLMLGTLIFEGSGEEDVLRLLVGALPRTRTGVAQPNTQRSSLPVSPHYARVLAALAKERGFDGYLLNFECPLQGGLEQTRALAAWIGLLERELKRQVGEHAQAIWYDSVVFTGQLRWQDRLNNYNLPYFLSSSAFFTNYTWPPHYPSTTAQYLLSLDQPTSAPTTKAKTLNDMYVGVDVWGRGSHGGGGFGSFQAIAHIDPASLGLSVALFGQAWSWESEQDKPGWDWDAWWEYEGTLWVGPEDATQVVPVPSLPPDAPRIPACDAHAVFRPVAGFFPRAPPPNPGICVFYTSFCPGAGRAWWVEGRKVMESESGWTDVDKQTSVGDMLWPKPGVSWEDGVRDYAPPSGTAALDMREAWMGGSSLRLMLSDSGSQADDAFFRCIWLPIQSLAITPKVAYDATIVFKLPELPYDVELALSAKSLSASAPQKIDITPVSYSEDLAHGWTKTCIRFTLDSQHPTDVLAALGLVIGIASEDPTVPSQFAFHVGALFVAPVSSANATHSDLQVLWADYAPTTPTPAPTSNKEKEKDRTHGALTWEVAASFAPLAPPSALPHPEDPAPLWVLDHPDRWLTAFLYFNIYVVPRQPNQGVPPPAEAAFIGTTGLDGRRNWFAVERAVLPEGLRETVLVRFYVQGITDRGEVLPWERCAFVDVDFGQ